MFKNDKVYLAMSTDELSALTDNELFYAVMVRTEQKAESFENWKDGVDSLNPSQKIFYSLNWLEVEVNNGGLCQFFVNSSRMVAPYISEYMAIVGAFEHKELFDNFILSSEIDFSDLTFFDIDDLGEFEEKYEAYPFDDYDNEFYDMEPLETYLTKFAKEHLEDF